MHIYHQLLRSTLHHALKKGLKCKTRGEKGDDALIKKTDDYLDANRPEHISNLRLSRNTAVYGYLGDAHSLIDIRYGTRTPITEYTNKTHQLLELHVAPDSCFISDLDRFDAVKAAIGSKNIGTLKRLAKDYWQSIVPFSSYLPGQFTRPEAMITRDVPPGDIAVVE
jgi:hypothetical protein